MAGLLPSGGKVIFDESRHPQTSYTATMYDTMTTLTIVTSNPLEAGLLSLGILLILAVIVLRARDKESWIHRFDISSVHRRAVLPDTRNVQVDHLRRALLQKLRMLNSLSNEELASLSPIQKANMIKDSQLSELLLNEQKIYSPEEIRATALKLRAWGKQDGVDGLVQAKTVHPDLILMDIQLPRMDGFEATQRLRSDQELKDIPIIALTALAMPNDRQRCLDAGMNEYINKPDNLRTLAKTIQKLLLLGKAGGS